MQETAKIITHSTCALKGNSEFSFHKTSFLGVCCAISRLNTTATE